MLDSFAKLGLGSLSRRRVLALGFFGAASAALAACSSAAPAQPTAAGGAAPAATQAPAATSAAAPTTAPAPATAATAASPTAAAAAAPTVAPTVAAQPASGTSAELTFFYPVGVAGPLSKLIDGLTGQFNQQQNGAIKVTPVYSGDYLQSLSKAQTALQGGKPPDVVVLNATAIYTLQDMNAVIGLNDLIKASGDNVADDFFPAFMANSKLGDTIYGIPFQRSTLVYYYNTDLLTQNGLDAKGPQTWDDVISFGTKLTQRQGNTVSRWGVGFPSSGSSYWEFQALAIEAGQNVMGDVGNKVFFNTDAAIKALQWQIDLAKSHQIMNSGTIDWGNLPTDFAGAKTAMIYHSTGSLSFIAKQSKFNVGVAFCPKDKQFGSPTGGGNLYIFKDISPANQAAAWKFVQFMTTPATLAQWSIDTGYVAPRKASYDVPAYKDYTTKFPQALVARDQLQYAQNELGTHQMAQVQTILSNGIQAALTGKQSPKDALTAAQGQAEQLLANFKT
ncbi:MAG TPA: ABC transporter substrate-binding protein [Chloroflexota bacterium]|nr:ABC transporter substrate-binding protein [Chloroflexota bacterium]